MKVAESPRLQWRRTWQIIFRSANSLLTIGLQNRNWQTPSARKFRTGSLTAPVFSSHQNHYQLLRAVTMLLLDRTETNRIIRNSLPSRKAPHTCQQLLLL